MRGKGRQVKGRTSNSERRTRQGKAKGRDDNAGQGKARKKKGRERTVTQCKARPGQLGARQRKARAGQGTAPAETSLAQRPKVLIKLITALIGPLSGGSISETRSLFAPNGLRGREGALREGGRGARFACSSLWDVDLVGVDGMALFSPDGWAGFSPVIIIIYLFFTLFSSLFSLSLFRQSGGIPREIINAMPIYH